MTPASATSTPTSDSCPAEAPPSVSPAASECSAPWRLLTTGRWLTGPEAVEWGLALRSVPGNQLDEELENLLASLRTKSRTGLGWIKSVTQAGRHLPIRDGVALESSAFVQYFTTSPHPRQGIQAFKEKTPARILNGCRIAPAQTSPPRRYPAQRSPKGPMIYSSVVSENSNGIADAAMPRGDQD